ncbi:hypothetical protein PCH70_28160 [Pseudomonas cichorii JBC1]|nr:hypothetical protein PCH70_28160 [Pseudomonas cichorii JBC1]
MKFSNDARQKAVQPMVRSTRKWLCCAHEHLAPDPQPMPARRL